MKSTFFNTKNTKRVLVTLILITFFNCNKYNEQTTVTVLDPVKHYYPIVQGSDLKIFYEIINTGDTTLFIDEIQWSCGCIVKNHTENIPAKEKGYIEFIYDSTKNIGLVNHYIYLYGNLKDNRPIEFSFDVHVVPGADYTRDYEEHYFERAGLEGLVDGLSNEKGYYVNFEEEEEFY